MSTNARELHQATQLFLAMVAACTGGSKQDREMGAGATSGAGSFTGGDGWCARQLQQTPSFRSRSSLAARGQRTGGGGHAQQQGSTPNVAGLAATAARAARMR